jgi:predicted dehydrogenase
MKKIKVAVIGTGGAGKYHAMHYSKDPNAELAAVCDKIEDKVKDFAKQHNAPKTYLDYNELADDHEIEAVSICTPNYLHLEIAKKMFECGKHVLVEKPMATNAPDCQKMVDAAKKNNCKLQIGNMWRYHPDVLFVKEAIEEGRIGEVVKVKGYGIHVNKGPKGWFIDKKQAGGGMLIDMGIHAINTIRFVLGDPKAKSVYAYIDTRYGKYDVDDVAIVMIEFANDTMCVIESGMWNPYADGKEASTQLFGTKGYARIFPTELQHSVEGTWSSSEPETKYKHLDLIMHERQIAHFMDCIINDKPPAVSGEIAVEDMRIIDAAYKSAAQKQKISLN